MTRKASVLIEKDERGFTLGALNSKDANPMELPARTRSQIFAKRSNYIWKRCLMMSRTHH
jgi:hypothetical protein